METQDLKKILKILINLGLGVSGVVLIFLACYLFGWDFLSEYLYGNDMGMALVNASWFDRFFPNIPQWFPLHGNGVSLFQGTHIGAPLITVITSRLLPINLVQTMHLWEFLSIYLTALGIFVFVRVKFKSFIAAVLAGIFYPLSNASWTWLSEIGLYANGMCFIFYPPTILALDFFLTELFGKKRQRRAMLWFFLTSLFAGLGILVHFTAGTVLFETIFVYAFAFSLFTQGKKLKNLLLGVGMAALMVLVASLLAGFWLFPFLRYIGLVSRNLLPSWSFEQIPYISLRALFGLAGYETLSITNAMWYVFFSRPVWVLAFVGMIFAFLKKNRRAMATSVLFVFFVLYTVMPGLFPWLVKTFIIFWRDIYIRSLIPAIIFIPVLAGWGCLALAQAIAKFIPKVDLTPLLSLIVAVFACFLLKGPPLGAPDYQWPCYQGFGRWWRTHVDYCHLFEKLGQIDLKISLKSAPFDEIAQEIIEKFNPSPDYRVDISPKKGPLIPVWSNVSDVPITSLFWYGLTLGNNFWGYQQGVFYVCEDLEPIEAIPELASWYGIRDVILSRLPDTECTEENPIDPIWRYNPKDWEELVYDKGRNTQVNRFKAATGLATWTNRPTVLVIGNKKQKAYEHVFRRATGGALSYQKALLVEGRDDGRLDKYTLEELKKFDGLILYGQVYEDKKKVDKLLSDYVKAGGRLFIESGWQFTNSEWQAHEALEVVPLEKLEWNTGAATQLKLNTRRIGGEFDKENFGPFIYYNDTWNVTTAERQDLKNWGEIVFERNGKPVIAVGNLGEGRVVWSGMNLLGHLQFYQSREEYSFTQKLFDWLLEGRKRENLSVSYLRPNPDRVEFSLNEDSSSPSFLLWREGFYPDWQAYIMREEGGGKREEKLPIYRAGPNMMLMRLPAIKKGEKVKLEFKLSFVPIASRIVSLLTFITLITFLSAPKTLSALAKAGRTAFSRLSKTVLEDEEY